MQSLRSFLFVHAAKIAFTLLALLVLVDRWILLQHFTFHYLDDDQSIMWFAAKEFGKGGFHEPYFFGQPYNTLFESLLAVPLLKMGVSYAVALSGVMSLLTLFPYFLLAVLLFRRKNEMQALLVLSVPLLLPIEFGMGTAISRGCAVGIFFASFAVLAFFSKGKNRFFAFGFFGMLALYANQNAALLVFPLGLWCWLENFRDKKLYVQTIAGSILPALAWYFSNRFYKVHPEYVVHNSWKLDFSTGRIIPHEWNHLFGDVMPVFWHWGILMFPLLLALCFLLYKQEEKKAALALFAGTLLLLFALTVNKVHDGYDTVFYSWSRMFIALPLLLAVFVSKIHLPQISLQRVGIFLLVPLTFFLVKCVNVSAVVQHEIVDKPEHNMYVSEIPVLKTLCDSIHVVAQKEKAGLLIIGRSPEKHQLDYACPCLEENFPVTIEPQLDRRTWLLKEEAMKKYTNILFAGFTQEELTAQMNKKLERVSTQPLLFVLRNNSLPTEVLLDSLGLPMRAH